MRRKPAALGMLIAVTLLTACGGGGGGTSDDGPLIGSDLSLGQPVDVGKDFSLGTVLLFVDSGSKAAKIERVRLVGVKGSMELLGVRTRLLPSDSGTFTGIASFPPEKYESAALSQQDEVPVARTRTPGGGPEEGLQLVIGLRMTQAGVSSARGVEVTYKVGDRKYTETYDQSVHLCAPYAAYEDCPPAGEAEDFGDGVLG